MLRAEIHLNIRHTRSSRDENKIREDFEDKGELGPEPFSPLKHSVSSFTLERDSAVSSILLGWLEDVCFHSGGLGSCVPTPRGVPWAPRSAGVAYSTASPRPVTVYPSAAIEAKECSQVAQQPVVALALGSLSPSWLSVSLRDRKSLDWMLGCPTFQAWFCQKMLLSKSLGTSSLHRKSEGVF